MRSRILSHISAFLKSLFWLSPNSAAESRELREQIAEEKRAERERRA